MPAKILSEAKLSDTDLWVFGYGSLMWRPGFEFIEQVPARLIGEHRALCVYSFDHRGTPEKPGLVLGLDRGGNCRGIAYRVAAEKRAETIDYLRAREQVTMVYRETWRRVWLDDDPQLSVHALCYMVDRGHQQYAGRLTLAEGKRAIDDGVVTKGMIPKLEESFAAIAEGVRAVHIVGRLSRGDLAREVTTPGSVGTVLVA